MDQSWAEAYPFFDGGKRTIHPQLKINAEHYENENTVIVIWGVAVGCWLRDDPD
jgi:hypothetical protein